MAVGTGDGGFLLIAIHRDESVFYLPAWELPCEAKREAAALGKGSGESGTYKKTQTQTLAAGV